MRANTVGLGDLGSLGRVRKFAEGGSASGPDQFAGARAAISAEYPALAPHINDAEISYGDPQRAQGRGLEFFPPWERDNPTPGKAHVQIFDRDLSNEEVKHAIAGDMLHLLGANDPRNNQPIDSKFRALRDEFAGSITMSQDNIDRRSHSRDIRAYGEEKVGNFKDWMERSRIDAYIRGNLFPDRADNWKGHYSDEQIQILNRIKSYLRESNMGQAGGTFSRGGSVRKFAAGGSTSRYRPDQILDFVTQNANNPELLSMVRASGIPHAELMQALTPLIQIVDAQDVDTDGDGNLIRTSTDAQRQQAHDTFDALFQVGLMTDPNDPQQVGLWLSAQRANDPNQALQLARDIGAPVDNPQFVQATIQSFQADRQRLSEHENQGTLSQFWDSARPVIAAAARFAAVSAGAYGAAYGLGSLTTAAGLPAGETMAGAETLGSGSSLSNIVGSGTPNYGTAVGDTIASTGGGGITSLNTATGAGTGLKATGAGVAAFDAATGLSPLVTGTALTGAGLAGANAVASTVNAGLNTSGANPASAFAPSQTVIPNAQPTVTPSTGGVPPAVPPPTTVTPPTTTTTPPPPAGPPVDTKTWLPVGMTPADIIRAAIPIITAITADDTSTTPGTTAADTAAAIAREQWDYYKTNYQPLETARINRALTSDSPEEFARARGAANADVTGAFNRSGRQMQSRLQSFGINPGSPAYQAGMGSMDLAQGAATAGALTGADRYTRSYSDALQTDVMNTGKGIPSASVAGLTGASNAATYSGNAAFNRNQTTQQNIGRGLTSGLDLIDRWFGRNNSGINSTGSTTRGTDYSPNEYGYADGGTVINAKRTGDGEYDATMLTTTLQRHGLSPEIATTQAHSAAARHKQAFTPHMRRFAQGGGVGSMPMDASNMGTMQGPGTETSDSIPATIDGQEPAALSDGEFVMSAPVMDMTGEEIMTAINDAALQKRQRGLEPRQPPMNSNEAPSNAGMGTYARGGRVARMACHGLGG